MNKEKVFAWIESLEDMADQSDRYFVERTELYKENQEKDKEIERLNTELEEKKKIINKFIADENGGVSYKLQNENERLNNIIEGQQIEIKKSWKEINKYKNIIEELEKWLNERLEKLDMNGFDDDIYNGFEYSLDKLKALKEGK